MTKTEKNTPEPSESAPRIVATKDLFELTFNAMAREVDTSRARVTRFMTFNGFLIAALALLEKLDQSDPLRILLLLTCSIAGWASAKAVKSGLVASQEARNKIRKFWDGAEGKDLFPDFYAEETTSDMARKATLQLPTTVLWIWGGLFLYGILSALWAYQLTQPFLEFVFRSIRLIE